MTSEDAARRALLLRAEDAFSCYHHAKSLSKRWAPKHLTSALRTLCDAIVRDCRSIGVTPKEAARNACPRLMFALEEGKS